MTNNILILTLVATLGTWFLTALGSSIVFFINKTNDKLLNCMLGFSSGVMIAASFWSLLQPAIELSKSNFSIPAWIIVSVGFVSGAYFIWICEKIFTKFSKQKNVSQNSVDYITSKKTMMLLLSITLHNIPEGLAIGVAFGSIYTIGLSKETILTATAVAIGIGIQNFPEGAAVSLPLRKYGLSRSKSFFYGQASGMVEPISGLLGATLVVYMKQILPFALAFAAGCMILVAVHDLIPESQKQNDMHPYFSTFGIIFGFTSMMILDVAFL